MEKTKEELIQVKIAGAIEILSALQVDIKVRNTRSALVLLALANLSPLAEWKDAIAKSMSIVGNTDNPKYPGIMRFMNSEYLTTYKENSRETIRRQTVHQFVQAGILIHNPDNPSLPINSKDNHYKLTGEVLNIIKHFNLPQFNTLVNSFLTNSESLVKKYAKTRESKKIPITLPDGSEKFLSPGKHNVLQVGIVTEFAREFANGGELLYLGDTANKQLYLNIEKLRDLGIEVDKHSKLPDVILYDSSKKWLFLVEAVTAHGPVSYKRYLELEELFQNCKVGKVYVSTFLNVKDFAKYSSNIAWETEVWIMDNPKHMIHYNGDRFLGPR